MKARNLCQHCEKVLTTARLRLGVGRGWVLCDRCFKNLKRESKRRDNPPRVIGEIPGRLEKIFYLRQGRGVSRSMRGPYQHTFKSAAKILALSDGSILIRPMARGRKLWTSLPH